MTDFSGLEICVFAKSVHCSCQDRAFTDNTCCSLGRSVKH